MPSPQVDVCNKDEELETKLKSSSLNNVIKRIAVAELMVHVYIDTRHPITKWDKFMKKCIETILQYEVQLTLCRKFRYLIILYKKCFITNSWRYSLLEYVLWKVDSLKFIYTWSSEADRSKWSLHFIKWIYWNQYSSKY